MTEIIKEMEESVKESVEEFWHRHHPGHGGEMEHHEIAVKAFELYEQMIVSGGVDFGSEFYWYSAEFALRIIPQEPLPPPIE